MGWRCSVNLYLPPLQVGPALLAVSRAVVPSADPPCAVTLPGGEVIRLPFAPVPSITPEPVVIGRKSAWFEVVLRVPADEVTDEWWDDEPDDECIALDALQLTVATGERYAELSFTATTGAASSVLFESESAHAVLLGVLRQAGGLAGVILTDTVVEVRDLAAPDRLLNVDWDWVQADDEAHFLDRLAEQVVRQRAGGA
ncbi:hypothetical protein [Zavarzinella formosa]|uniref:hypothetical protein n=1 Tax=Zavarzinella formosa TaxID=360055 RepID=UPI0003684EB6|nr:hypothetical protein [Zavarzinella formosa]